MKKILSYFKELKSLISADSFHLFFKGVFQKAKENDIFIHAMGMVYITLLSIVPFFIFSFYIMNLFNFFGKINTIVEEIESLILNNLAAGTGKALIDYLEMYILNIDIEQLGTISFISLIFIIVFMLARVEMTFNKIWNVEDHRDLFKRFVSFWTFITLGTFLITLFLTLSLLFAEKYLGLWLSGDQISQSNIFSFISFSFNFLFFIIIYYLVPNTKVEPSAALIAGLFSGFLFILTKSLYGIYTKNLVTYSQIYGSLSIFPLFLIWLYLIWLIVLLGAIISYVFQHRSSLVYMLKKKEINQGLKNLIPTAVLLTLYKNYEEQKSRRISLNELLEKIKLPADYIEESIIELKNNNLIAETEDAEFLPLKKENELSIWDVYQSNLLDENFNIENIFKEKEMQRLYTEIIQAQKSDLKKMRFVDFLN